MPAGIVSSALTLSEASFLASRSGRGEVEIDFGRRILGPDDDFVGFAC